MDDVKQQGKGMSTFKKIISFIPRLIKALIKSIKSKLSSKNDDDSINNIIDIDRIRKSIDRFLPQIQKENRMFNQSDVYTGENFITCEELLKEIERVKDNYNKFYSKSLDDYEKTVPKLTDDMLKNAPSDVKEFFNALNQIIPAASDYIVSSLDLYNNWVTSYNKIFKDFTYSDKGHEFHADKFNNIPLIPPINDDDHNSSSKRSKEPSTTKQTEEKETSKKSESSVKSAITKLGSVNISKQENPNIIKAIGAHDVIIKEIGSVMNKRKNYMNKLVQVYNDAYNKSVEKLDEDFDYTLPELNKIISNK